MIFKIGDQVSKKDGMMFRGTVLSSYMAPDSRTFDTDEEWIVVMLHRNTASDHLQHLYPARLFEHEGK